MQGSNIQNTTEGELCWNTMDLNICVCADSIFCKSISLHNFWKKHGKGVCDFLR